MVSGVSGPLPQYIMKPFKVRVAQLDKVIRGQKKISSNVNSPFHFSSTSQHTELLTQREISITNSTTGLFK